MKSKTSVIIGSIFAAYVTFVTVIVHIYEPTPDEMNWEDRQVYNSQKMTDLSLGQNITEVKSLLGKADFSEAKAVQDTQLQVLFYRTHLQKSDGITTKEECTPLIFNNNKLIAWGEDTYQQYLDVGIETALNTVNESPAIH